MSRKKWLFAFGALLVAAMMGAWAMESNVAPQEFNPNDPKDYPVLTNITIDIKGISEIGQIFMLEGIENTTSAVYGKTGWDAGDTSYARLVLHGVFDKKIRDWRNGVIDGTVTKRDIWLDLTNSKNQKILRVIFKNAFPVKYSLPPFAIDSTTRYMERLELVYDYFTITSI
ncbi:MAG: phage tail protein [Candidatus Omnitrophota bacterium]